MFKTHGDFVGHSRKASTEYVSYRSMLRRVNERKVGSRNYEYYYLRGIEICDRWLGKEGFLHFLQDMGRKPSKSHSLDRINNDLGYFPTNCRWATKLEQVENRRYTKYWYKGELKTLTHIAREEKLGREFLRHRIVRLGMTLEEAISVPKGLPRGRHVKRLY